MSIIFLGTLDLIVTGALNLVGFVVVNAAVDETSVAIVTSFIAFNMFIIYDSL
jgi:hypothetical protein